MFKNFYEDLSYNRIKHFTNFYKFIKFLITLLIVLFFYQT